VAVSKVSRSRRGTEPQERLSIFAEIDDSRALRSSEVQAGGCGRFAKGQGRRSRRREAARSGAERRRDTAEGVRRSACWSLRSHPVAGAAVPEAVVLVRGARPQRRKTVLSPSWAGRVRGSEVRGTNSEGEQRQEGIGRWVRGNSDTARTDSNREEDSEVGEAGET